ncbi:unnamed protein product [Aureobasidium uvarum]|uniref:Uncharacterized protein n=1 Tax=Aureobasidium uvarum TaxID=2773716 RepID=A0A9N8KG78_9PEZI|nr:unnamed protein product [Aureobasidium uvarum]
MTTNTTENAAERQRLEGFFSASRQGILDSIRRDPTNDGGLMQNIQFAIQYPQDILLRNGMRKSDMYLEIELKDLWWKTIEAAKFYPADDEGRQYRLIAWIAGARGRPPVSSTQQDTYVADGGKILWKDLPFFQEALESAWADRASLSKVEWTNLNAFVSRLMQVTGMDLMSFGLETIREALEEGRPLFMMAGEGQQGERCIADLLPATLLWLRHSHGFMKIMTVVVERAIKEGLERPSGCGGNVMPGELAVASEVSRGGLSLARRRFWRLRLLEIGQMEGGAEGNNDATVADACEWAKRIGTWNLDWPAELKDVPGWEEAIRYRPNPMPRN